MNLDQDFDQTLVDLYLHSDECKNEEFERTILENLFRDSKWDLIRYALNPPHSTKKSFSITPLVQALIFYLKDPVLFKLCQTSREELINECIITGDATSLCILYKSGASLNNIDPRLILTAAEKGYLDVVELVLKERMPSFRAKIIIKAARSRGLPILDWAYITRIYFVEANILHNIVLKKCESGKVLSEEDIKIMKNFSDRGYSLNFLVYFCVETRNSDMLKILWYNLGSTCEIYGHWFTGFYTSTHKIMDTISYLHELNLTPHPFLNESFFRKAFKDRHIEILTWLRDNNCPIGENEKVMINIMKTYKPILPHIQLFV